MRNSKILIAMREGVAAAMRADETTFIVGEGIANRGGVFTESLYVWWAIQNAPDNPGLLWNFGIKRSSTLTVAVPLVYADARNKGGNASNPL
jgi:hypothetical protein